MNTAYLNNKFVPLDKAKISILDRGLLYGDGVFETMRLRKGRIAGLGDHMKRLLEAVKFLRINFTGTKKSLENIIYAVLRKNKLKEAYVKVIITRGVSTGLPFGASKSKPTLLVYALPFKGLPKKIYRKGISVNIMEGISKRLKEHKTLNYLDNLLCRSEARRKGFDDAVIASPDGVLKEATSSNIFLVKGKTLITPRLEGDILPGITRKNVIDIARKKLKYKIKKAFIKRKNLKNADEVFLTNSIAGIIPVVKIDKGKVKNGLPGPITRKLMEVFDDED